MPSGEKRTFDLPPEQANVGSGLRALQERDNLIERWLREEVVGAFDALEADPGRALTPEQVLGALRARHTDRLRQEKSAP